jgi:transporter family protein
MDKITIAIAILVAFMWSVGVITQKYALQRLPMFTVFAMFSFVYTTCTLITIIYNYDSIKGSLHKLDYKTFAIIVCGAIFCFFIPNLLNLAILKNNKSFIVVALTYISPMFSMLLGYMLLHEQVSVKELGGVLLIVLGIIMIATVHREEFVIQEGV